MKGLSATPIIYAVIFVAIMVFAYYMISNWIYPNVIKQPFGNLIFVLIVLGVFGTIVALIYFVVGVVKK